MSERELKTIDLPSGVKAKVVTFFTRGEVRAIKQSQWQGTDISVDDSEKIIASKINPGAGDLLDDEIVFQGTKNVNDQPITREIIDGLTIEDFDILLKELKGLFLGKTKK